VPPKLRELALAGKDSRTFRRALRPLLSGYVPFDAYCMSSCDPGTRAITTSVGDGLEASDAHRLFSLERRGKGLNLLSDLGAGAPLVVTMCKTTRGAPWKCVRMRTIFLPKGFTDELRAALTWAGHVWGYLHLYRKAGVFEDVDVTRIERIAPLLAFALARATLSRRDQAESAHFAPQLVELDRRGRVRRASETARELLRILDLDGHQLVPHGVYAASGAAGCVRAPFGDWVAFRRFDLGGRAVVLIDRATPEEVRRTTMLAFGLTAREREVAALVIDGAGNAELARELRIGLHTAKDHVKAVLRKTGANTRSELARALAADS
jgi:DNA-binding CsgD family transcriptional regulator